MNIDIQKLTQDIHRIQEQIREVKVPLRSTWTKFMDSEQCKLLALRSQATELYTLRAWLRGKCHRLNPPEALRALGVVEWDAKAHNQKIAERVAERYPRDVAEAS